MKIEDIVFGMKVVPHAKTAHGWEGLNNSGVWKSALNKNQPYLFVEEFDDNECAYELSENEDEEGDFFNAEDFEPYIENNTEIIGIAKDLLSICNGINWDNDEERWNFNNVQKKRMAMKLAMYVLKINNIVI
jgi:hypothetical protein